MGNNKSTLKTNRTIAIYKRVAPEIHEKKKKYVGKLGTRYMLYDHFCFRTRESSVAMSERVSQNPGPLVPPSSRKVSFQDSYPSNEAHVSSSSAVIGEESLIERVSGTVKKVVKKTMSGFGHSLRRGMHNAHTLSQRMMLPRKMGTKSSNKACKKVLIASGSDQGSATAAVFGAATEAVKC